MKSDFLKVPIELLQAGIREGYLQELRAFLVLKLYWNGSIECNRESILLLTSLLKYKVNRSTLRNLRNLEGLGWVNYDIKSNRFFVKGFEALREKFGFKLRTGVYLYQHDLRSNKQFKGFVAGAIANSLVNSQKRKLNKLERIKGSSTEDNFNFKSGYCQIANSVLMSVFNCSQGQAHNLKKLAKRLGYISVKKNFVNTGVSLSEIQAFKKGQPELVPRITVKKGKILLKDSDLLMGKMKISRREKI